MQQYWVTKKSVLRKLGGKEDDCIVASDAELDAKLELFKWINESCINLQRMIDLYQERLCYLAQEENALGRYLKECGKIEKNACAGQIMTTAGKAIAYVGHQRLTMRPPLIRLHNEVESFRNQGVTDTKVTVLEMEKARTEYRAALSWMKSASSQLDPDTGYGLDRFRKAQAYVKNTKAKFDRFTLACLQKIDLLAAARCNMFSHALVPYHSSIITFSTRSAETLTLANSKLEMQPYEFSVVPGLAASMHDKDRSTFFTADYVDDEPKKAEPTKDSLSKEESTLLNISDSISDILGDLGQPEDDTSGSPSKTKTNTEELLELSWLSGLPSNFLESDLMPSKFLQEGGTSLLDQLESGSGDDKNKDAKNANEKIKKKNDKTEAQVSWLSLFAELDPLANPAPQQSTSGDVA